MSHFPAAPREGKASNPVRLVIDKKQITCPSLSVAKVSYSIEVPEAFPPMILELLLLPRCSSDLSNPSTMPSVDLHRGTDLALGFPGAQTIKTLLVPQPNKPLSRLGCQFSTPQLEACGGPGAALLVGVRAIV